MTLTTGEVVIMISIHVLREEDDSVHTLSRCAAC